MPGAMTACGSSISSPAFPSTLVVRCRVWPPVILPCCVFCSPCLRLANHQILSPGSTPVSHRVSNHANFICSPLAAVQPAVPSFPATALESFPSTVPAQCSCIAAAVGGQRTRTANRARCSRSTRVWSCLLSQYQCNVLVALRAVAARGVYQPS